MTQPEKDAAFLVDWLKSQVVWATEEGRLPPPGYAHNRRMYEAFLAMPEADWRLFVAVALMRRMPMFPPLPQAEKPE